MKKYVLMIVMYFGMLSLAFAQVPQCQYPGGGVGPCPVNQPHIPVIGPIVGGVFNGVGDIIGGTLNGVGDIFYPLTHPQHQCVYQNGTIAPCPYQ